MTVDSDAASTPATAESDPVAVLDGQPSPMTDALEQLRDQIRALGIPATLDLNDVATPGCWLVARTVTYPRLRGSTWSADVLLIVGAGASDGAATRQLEQLHSLIVPALLTPDDDPELFTLGLPADPTTAYPAMRLPLDIDI